MGRVRPKPGQNPFKLDIDYLLQTDGKSGDVLARFIDVAGDAPHCLKTHDEEVEALREEHPGGSRRAVDGRRR